MSVKIMIRIENILVGVRVVRVGVRVMLYLNVGVNYRCFQHII
jgi:hypothetical protein